MNGEEALPLDCNVEGVAGHGDLALAHVAHQADIANETNVARIGVGVRGSGVVEFEHQRIGFEAGGRDVGEIVRRDVHPALQDTLRLHGEHE